MTLGWHTEAQMITALKQIEEWRQQFLRFCSGQIEQTHT